MFGSCYRPLAALGLALGLHAAPAAAEVRLGETGLTLSATPALTTDYVFRGISQTRGRPAAQLTAELEHASGIYIGGFVTNVTFAGTDARQEVDVVGGYRFSALGMSWDLGGIYYGYPGYNRQPGQERLDFFEFALRASREFGPVTALGAFHWSPEFSGRSGNGYYLEGGLDVALPFEFVLSGRLGHQWIETNPRFGVPDYLWYSVGVSRPLPGGFAVALTWTDTDLSRSECFAGQKVCDDRVVLTVSRPF